MIHIIFGEPGVGKTALNTYFAVTDMVYNRQRYLDCIKDIEKSKLGITPPPSPHVVYSNYKINSRCIDSSGMLTYPVNPFKMVLPNDNGVEYDVFAPFAQFHITEGQAVFDSRKSKNFRGEASRFFENHRHNEFDIFIDVQRPKLIDLNIRELADFTEVLSMKHKYDNNGVICNTKWSCRKFESWFSCEQYLMSGKSKSTLYTPVKYTHNGNIFSNYNDKENKKAFYDTKMQARYKSWDNLSENYLQPTDNYYS